MIINVIDETMPSDGDKKNINIQILEGNMSQKNSARTVYDAIKEKVVIKTKNKLLFMRDEEFRKVVLAGINNGSIVIQGDFLGIEEQISKEVLLSNNLKNYAK